MGSSSLLPPPGQPKQGPDPAFRSAALPNIVTFGLEGIAPPSPLYIQRDDQLVIAAVTNIAGGETVTINGRVLLAPFPRGGQPDNPTAGDPTQQPQSSNIIEPMSNAFALTTPYQSFIKVIPLTEGYLLGLTCVTQNAQTRGQTFVRGYINRGITGLAATGASQVLFSDYVTTAHPTGWPNGRTVHGTEGPGNIRVIVVGNPAAGADWSQIVTLGARWRISSVNALLTTSAAVANRLPQIRLRHLSNTIWLGPPSQLVPASTAANVSSGPNSVSSATVPTLVNCALPDFPILAGSGATTDISSVTVNIQAADQWSNIALEIEEWLDQF